MKNLDNIKTLDTARAELFNALTTDDVEVQETAFNNFVESLQSEISDRAKASIDEVRDSISDEQILVNRGVRRAFTTEEKKYFNAVVERGGFEGVEATFPTTIIQDVFANLRTNHPLLSRIDMKDTTALAKYIFAVPNEATAYWGPICEDIKQMILAGFKEVNLESSRLSGFVAICKAMLELGPNWLGQYITELIYEIMATSLESAVVAGTGKNQPIGMIKKLSGAVDGVYPDKDKIAMTTLDAKALAAVRGALAKAKLDSTGVVVMVNPVTYWSKVFGNLLLQTNDGAFVRDRLATGEEIIQSYAVPENTLVIGNPKNYFLGVSGKTRIDRYEETLAIEDMTLYVTKFYGFGIAKNMNAFFVADITNVEGVDIPALEAEAEEEPGV